MGKHPVEIASNVRQLIHNFLALLTHFVKTHLLFSVGTFYLVTVAILMWPQFLQKYPALIDDGTDLLQVSQLSHYDLLRIDLLDQQRTWPMRMQWRKLLTELFGIKIGWHFVVWGLVLWVIFWICFRICVKLRTPTWLAVFMPFLLIAEPSVYGNFYRLGTAEPIQTLLLLLGIYLLLQNRSGWAICIFLLNLFVKETSIFYLFPMLLYLFLNRRYAYLAAGVTGSLAFAGLLLYKQAHVLGSYTARSQFSVEYFSRGMSWQTWTFGLLLILTLLFFVTTKINQKKVFLLCLYLSTFAPFFIWNMGQQYYYQLPNHLIGMLIVAYLSGEIIKEKKTHAFVVMGATVLIYGYYFFSILLPHSVAAIKNWQQEYAVGGGVVEYLLTADLAETRIYNAIFDYERHDKISTFISGWRQSGAVLVPSSAEWYASETDWNKRIKIAQSTSESFFKDTQPKRLMIVDKQIVDPQHAELVRSFCGKPTRFYKNCFYFVYRAK